MVKYGLLCAALAGCLALSLVPQVAHAEEGGFAHESALQIRAIPIGLSLFSTTGYGWSLWDSPDSDLLTGTKLEVGAATSLSPAFAWGGPYVTFVPAAVLPIKASAQVMGYFGNFGYLHVPDDGDWSLEELDRSDDEGLGVGARGTLIHLQATPRLRIDRIVFTAETNAYWINMDVEGEYYEPYFDLLFEPSDFFFITRPTLGYLIGPDLSRWYLLLGLRWERTMTRDTNLTRDIAGLVFAWKVPETLLAFGDPTLAGFMGVNTQHPNRDQFFPYVGIQALFQF